MLRMTLWLRRSLPFEPMALSTLDTLEERLRAVGVKQSEQRCAYESRRHKAAMQDGYHMTSDAVEDMAGRTQWCAGQTPFFVSPKLDGVRLITYTTPSSSVKSTDDASQWTCYTRYGRALYGMFWLEEELRLLRALCGDPALVLDGELYLHRPSSDHTIHSKSEWNDEAAHEGGDAFKTGFLAVSALVNRMRGSSSQCATVEDILQYVRALPQYYIFDVASYQPAEHLRDALETMTEGRRHTSGGGALQRRHTSLRPALSTLFARTFTNSTHTSMSGCTLHDGQDALRCEAELQRVRLAALRRCHVDCVETLRVLPNMTPFSARLRTMHFLYTLLQLGRRSPLLRRGFLTQGTPKKLSRPGLDMALRNAIAPVRGDKGYVHMVPYRLAHNLPDAQQRHLTQYIQNGFEGAVIRSPGNVYEMREKRQDTVRHLVQPLHVGGKQTKSTAVMQSVPIVRLYAHGQAVAHSSKREGRTERTHTHAAPSAIAEEEEEEEDEQRIAQAAVSHARTLPRRCENAVKLLPYRDQEYAILRPLLKEPSRNPRTRQLVLIPRSRLMCERGVTHKILRTAASQPRNNDEEEEEKCTTSSAKKASDVVAFYGLHCLAENGRSFCVSLPKMSLERQRALLEHLLSVARKRQGRRGKGSSPASLTGLYATVKFAALTEHGVPRFGTVKAIRGGKGWFL